MEGAWISDEYGVRRSEAGPVLDGVCFAGADLTGLILAS